MTGFVLANAVVTTRPETLGQVLLVGGILIIEPFVLWFLTNKVSFLKLLLVSLTANIASSALGTIFNFLVVFRTAPPGYYMAFLGPMTPANLSGNLIIVGIAFLLSVLIEWAAYKPFKIPNPLKAAFLANLASYLILIIYILVITFWLPEETTHASYIKYILRSMEQTQEIYFREHGRFADSLDKLDLGISSTRGYNFSIRANNIAVFHYAIPDELHLRSRSFVNGIFLVSKKSDKVKTIKTILCEQYGDSIQIPEPKLHKRGQPICAPGTTRVR